MPGRAPAYARASMPEPPPHPRLWVQLREKQKMKRFYGMSEKQFRLFFERAERQKGVTGEPSCRCWSGAWTISSSSAAMPTPGPIPAAGLPRPCPGHDRRVSVPSFWSRRGRHRLSGPFGQVRGHPAVAEAIPPRPFPAGFRRTVPTCRSGSPACRRAPTSRCPSKSTWSSSCTPSEG